MFKKTTLGILSLFFVVACAENNATQLPAKETIATAGAPKAIGPYSQAVKVGNTLYCAGQIALDPETGELKTESIEEETRQVLKNLGAVLNAAGMDYNDVVRATVYMADIENYKRINSVYSEFFSESKPARAAVQVANLPAGANVEISCIAVKTTNR
jgi:2-iminobutanoate/2-iminopropanoate deaminase